MATPKKSEQDSDVAFDPAPELEQAVEAAAAAPEPAKAAPAKPGARYRVLSSGIAGAGGVGHYTGAELTAEQVGDAARIEKLLAKGAIEVI